MASMACPAAAYPPPCGKCYREQVSCLVAKEKLMRPGAQPGHPTPTKPASDGTGSPTTRMLMHVKSGAWERPG
eukprot:1155712-Pelagomonas_calceolata.AAC.4